MNKITRGLFIVVLFLSTTAFYSIQERHDKELSCLAEAIYFEARGESFQGQLAIAQVILNRVKNKRFPKTICGVVHEGRYNKDGLPVRNKCSFSYWCDGKPEKIHNKEAYETASLAAITSLQLPLHDFEDVLYYHAVYVRPDWVKDRVFIGRIGKHLFYK